MLARLEDSFRRLSEFSSDLAHEFRTPISNLMTETQVALSRMRSADEYREVLYSNLGSTNDSRAPSPTCCTWRMPITACSCPSRT
ncbi:MAG: hypothetical protein U1F17_03950 [Burkholderiaceae bacterium]